MNRQLREGRLSLLLANRDSVDTDESTLDFSMNYRGDADESQ
jgi:hypothetical protein